MEGKKDRGRKTERRKLGKQAVCKHLSIGFVFFKPQNICFVFGVTVFKRLIP